MLARAFPPDFQRVDGFSERSKLLNQQGKRRQISGSSLGASATIPVTCDTQSTLSRWPGWRASSHSTNLPCKRAPGARPHQWPRSGKEKLLRSSRYALVTATTATATWPASTAHKIQKRVEMVINIPRFDEPQPPRLLNGDRAPLVPQCCGKRQFWRPI